MTDDELYEIYERAAAKVRGGGKLSNLDYGKRSAGGFEAYEKAGQVAVAIGSEDGTRNAPAKTKAELIAAIKERAPN